MRSASSTTRCGGPGPRSSPPSIFPESTPARARHRSFTGNPMARITVEDCLVKIPNRFQLGLAAALRARVRSEGHAPKVETKNKRGVTALREIAAVEVGIEMLKKVPV